MLAVNKMANIIKPLKNTKRRSKGAITMSI
jgi:hypothetical protein